MIDSCDRVGGVDSCGRLSGGKNVRVVGRRVDAAVLRRQCYRSGNARTIKLLTARKESSDGFCAIEGWVRHPGNDNAITDRETKVPVWMLCVNVSKTVVPTADDYSTNIALESGLGYVLNISIPSE